MEQSPFEIRGVIEGFYGAFYTFPERNDLIRFIGAHGYNLYVYGPKNDRQHRNRWREPYPAVVMEQFRATAAIAAEAGVRFCYAISPLNYDSTKDLPNLMGKLKDMYDCGIRAFSVLVDDILCTVHHEPSCSICAWPADLDIALCNGLYEWLTALDPSCSLSICPTQYHGRAPFGTYLHDLGVGLHPEIDIFYSGPHVCSAELTTADVGDFAAAIQRRPLIWDNYPVNDLAMRPYMHIGPIRSREATLHEVVRGIVVNPMLQAEASKIPLRTWAEYFHDPYSYDPWGAWERALLAIGGAVNYDALLRFAENSLHSCLRLSELPKLERLVKAAIADIESDHQGACGASCRELRSYLDVLDEACYELKNRMENLRLRHDLLQWVEALDEWVWVGKRAMRLLDAMEHGKPHDHLARGLNNAMEEVQAHSKRTSGNALLPFGRAVLEHVGQLRSGQAAGREHTPTVVEHEGYPNGLAA